MPKFASLARRCATGLVATQMLLGAVSVSTLALAAPVRAAEAAPFPFPQAPAAPQPPAPQAPAPQAPAPQTPAPQAPAPQTPGPVAEAPPAPATPATPTPVVTPAPAAPQAPAAQPAAPAAPASQGISYLPQHGDWQGFSCTTGGVQYAGVLTHMNEGGVLAFTATKDGQYSLIMADPRWNLRNGMTVPVRLTTGGRAYTLTATAYGNRLEVEGITKEMIQDLLRSNQAQVDAGNGAVVWTMALDGFFDAAQDAAKVIQA